MSRAHSKFSASASDRWFTCPGSVELSEGQPDKSSVYSLEGTDAHEILEALLRLEIDGGSDTAHEMLWNVTEQKPSEMIAIAKDAANFIVNLHGTHPGSELFAEERIWLDFIHPEMFGTYDAAVVDHFGILHVIDFKYGAGHSVNPRVNLQMIFYAIGLAHKFDWNFESARLWIIQPRIKGYNGPAFWDIGIKDLKSYVQVFKLAVENVLSNPTKYAEGQHCFFCKAKAICPAKAQSRRDEAAIIFSSNPLIKKKGDSDNGKSKEKSKKENNQKSIKEIDDFY